MPSFVKLGLLSPFVPLPIAKASTRHRSNIVRTREQHLNIRIVQNRTQNLFHSLATKSAPCPNKCHRVAAPRVIKLNNVSGRRVSVDDDGGSMRKGCQRNNQNVKRLMWISYGKPGDAPPARTPRQLRSMLPFTIGEGSKSWIHTYHT